MRRGLNLTGRAVAVEVVSKAAKEIGALQKQRETALLDEVWDPLRRYLDALMPFAPWELDKDTRYGRYKLQVDHLDEPQPLAAILSEGELTGVALSFLFAFNSVFGGWCRWPGIVLDDPFQAVDVVRISALFDILGGLVRERGRQLILTTHDLERAGWAQRRLRNHGVTVRIYELHRNASGLAVRTA